MSEFFSFIQKDLAEASENLTQKFQSLASAAGWNSNAINAVSVRNVHEFNIDDEMKESVEDLEYGSLGHNALSVMRSLQKEMDETILKVIGKAASDFVSKLAPGAFEK